MADEQLPDAAGGGDEPRKGPEPARSQPGDRRATAPKSGPLSFFTIAKKGQGYWTRMGTAIGAGGIGVLIAFEIFAKVQPYIYSPPQSHRDRNIAAAIALGFLVVYSLWAFWFTNKPSTVEFLIATDSEMKKVNWTTRKELIGSTKIVIIFMFLIAIFLFGCDLLFGAFFHSIHVLKTWF